MVLDGEEHEALFVFAEDGLLDFGFLEDVVGVHRVFRFEIILQKPIKRL